MKLIKKAVKSEGTEYITLVATKQELINIWGAALTKIALERERIKQMPETVKSINELEDIIFNK